MNTPVFKDEIAANPSVEKIDNLNTISICAENAELKIKQRDYFR